MVKKYIEFVKNEYTMDDLLQIMSILRGEDGCPWDKEQTHATIRRDLIEETYEAADAIDRNNAEDMAEEFGDLLLQVVFHSQIGKEHNEFDFNDVVNTVCKKLVYRHPHIFSDVVAETSEAVLDNWDKLKAKEKHMVSFTDTLKAVPVALPACVRAQKVQKRAAKAGYDFENINMAIEKLEEELSELKEALYLKDVDAANEEIGDLLFSTINLSRFLKADSEELLTASVNKFINRFEKAECLAVQEKTTLDKLDAEKLDTLWIKAKLSEK